MSKLVSTPETVVSSREVDRNSGENSTILTIGTSDSRTDTSSLIQQTQRNPLKPLDVTDETQIKQDKVNKKPRNIFQRSKSLYQESEKAQAGQVKRRSLKKSNSLDISGPLGISAPVSISSPIAFDLYTMIAPDADVVDVQKLSVEETNNTSLTAEDNNWECGLTDSGEQYYLNKTDQTKWFVAYDEDNSSYYYEEISHETCWSLPGLSSAYPDSAFTRAQHESPNTSPVKLPKDDQSNETKDPSQSVIRPSKLGIRSTSESGDTERLMATVCSPSAGSKNRFSFFLPKNNSSRKITKEHISGPLNYKIARSEKQGMVNVMVCGQNESSKNGAKWNKMFVLLTGPKLHFYKDQKNAAPRTNRPEGKPEFTLDIENIDFEEANYMNLDYQYVLQLTSRESPFSTSMYLVDVSKEYLMQEWKTALQYAKNWMKEERYSENNERIVYKKSQPSSQQDKFSSTKAMLSDYFTKRPTREFLKESGILKDSAVFGSTLEAICQREKTPIPIFVTRCIKAIENRGLLTKGLYRVNGNAAVVQKIRCLVDSANEYDLECDIWHQPDLTGVLKLFFRELKEPLFPTNVYNTLLNIIARKSNANNPQNLSRLNRILNVLQSIPPSHLATAKCLFEHLYRVMECCVENNMQASNLGIVLGINLMWPPENPQPAQFGIQPFAIATGWSPAEVMERCKVVEYIINETPSLFAYNPQESTTTTTTDLSQDSHIKLTRSVTKL